MSQFLKLEASLESNVAIADLFQLHY